MALRAKRAPTPAQFNAWLTRFAEELQAGVEEEVRRRWREERQLVWVREYTVRAHFVPYRGRRGRVATRRK